ncbi:MAG: hypothetical protein JWO03_2569 [Bacteroidetes bacterium]|nr:hypothetical protein [Bacteroidota bacterium]
MQDEQSKQIGNSKLEKMTTKIKAAFLVTCLFCVWLGACKKTQSPSITGIWTMSKFRFVVDSVDVPIIDVTYPIVQNDSANTIAVYNNGTFVMTRLPQASFIGTYKLTGNTIVFKDTNSTGTIVIDTIVSLTDHSLMLSQKSSSRYINPQDSLDTRMLTYHDTYTFTR